MPRKSKAQLLEQFKEYAVLHPKLATVDMHLMRAIREPTGFAHVLIYGPSGVGKTTMIRQIAKRLNENDSKDSGDNGFHNGHVSNFSKPKSFLRTAIANYAYVIKSNIYYSIDN